MVLRETCMADSELRLIIMRDLKSGTDSYLVAARVDNTWVVLDNRNMALDGAGHAVLAFDATGVKQFATSVAGAQHGTLPGATAAAPRRPELNSLRAARCPKTPPRFRSVDRPEPAAAARRRAQSAA